MTVYVVTEGDYSDYHLVAIFAEEEMAKEFCTSGGGDYEAWELNTWRSEQGKWEFTFDVATGAIKTEKMTADLEEPDEDCAAWTWNWNDGVRVIVKTGDHDRAVKIASERFMRTRAQFDTAKTLIERAAEWYVPYPAGQAVYPQGMCWEIAEVLAGIRKLPENTGNMSHHNTQLRKIMGI